jgi:thiamine kinase-like enzyme
MEANMQAVDKVVRRTWRKLGLSQKVGAVIKDSTLERSIHRRRCLKDSFKSSIWSVEIRGAGKPRTVILKIFKDVQRPESVVELNMYRYGQKLMNGLMPDIYFMERNVAGSPWWVGMEHVQPIKGQLEFTPHHFVRMVPALAEMHARTFGKRMDPHKKQFIGWLPFYDSKPLAKERAQMKKDTLEMLEIAMRRPELKALIGTRYPWLVRLLKKGPIYFPEVLEAGQSILHSDLQTSNMGCHVLGKKVWNIKFTDWEGARYAPVWFDLVNMIGIFFGYRQDWRHKEEAITKKCVYLYAHEMKKHGIAFKHDPYRLYQMAFLQRILEKTLSLQLTWAVKGIKPAKLLPPLLVKLDSWGKEYKLH